MFLPGNVRRTANLNVGGLTGSPTIDTELFFTADAANEWWGIHAVIRLSAPNEDGFEYVLGNVEPAGQTTSYLYDLSAGTLLTADYFNLANAWSAIAFGVDLDVDVLIIETICKTTAAGAVNFKWAKTADDYEDAVVGINSFMFANRLG
jgi:hypothetical protein